jgi:hypothetical protein
MCLDVFLAINILALEGSLPFFLDNYHPLKLYANLLFRRFSVGPVMLVHHVFDNQECI